MFIEFVQKNYATLQSDVANMAYGGNKSLLDEDVFHDTIVKCNQSLGRRELSDEDYKRYFLSSFKTNRIRECQYFRNKMEDKYEELPDIFLYDDDYSSIDFDHIMDLVDNKYGQTMAKLFMRWLNGESIRQIEEETMQTGLTYKFNIIRNMLRNNASMHEIKNGNF